MATTTLKRCVIARILLTSVTNVIDLIFVLLIALTAFKAGEYTGLKDANYDRATANYRLEQCQEVIRRKDVRSK
jgi:hypothetical protein